MKDYSEVMAGFPRKIARLNELLEQRKMSQSRVLVTEMLSGLDFVKFKIDEMEKNNVSK